MPKKDKNHLLIMNKKNYTQYMHLYIHIYIYIYLYI